MTLEVGSSVKDYAPIASIVGITAVACVAISQGINSWLVSLAYAALAGLGGFELQKIMKNLRKA